MLSKNQSKLITSLKYKKYRKQHQLFIAEGIKVVNELISSNYKLEKLFCTEDCYELFKNYNPQILSDKDLHKISGFTTPNKVLALFNLNQTFKIYKNGLILVLDNIKDPGNLGTIIRLGDWFGVEKIVCSLNSVDCFNHKVVQSSMGSIARVPIMYCDLQDFLKETKLPIYGALMNGDDIRSVKLMSDAILVMGNESTGISDQVLSLIKKKITIPRYSRETKTESLNVAAATAILLNEFRRN